MTSHYFKMLGFLSELSLNLRFKNIYIRITVERLFTRMLVVIFSHYSLLTMDLLEFWPILPELNHVSRVPYNCGEASLVTVSVA